MTKAKVKTTIGRREYVDLPDLGMIRVEAKVDTGAYTSALHYHHLEILQKNGQPVLAVTFYIGHKRNVVEFMNFSEKVVKSSTGQRSKRFVISTRIRMNEQFIRIRFTLSDRSDMRYPVLLGRRILTGRYLVDVGKKHVLGK